MGDSEKLSLRVVDECWLDINGLCRLPKAYSPDGVQLDQKLVDEHGKPKPRALLLMQQYKSCMEYTVPTPLFSVANRFMYASSCQIEGLEVSEADTLERKKEVMAETLHFALQLVVRPHPGLADITSGLISNYEEQVTVRLKLIILQSLLEMLLGNSTTHRPETSTPLEGVLILLPEQVKVPVGEFSAEELNELIHRAAVDFSELKPEEDEKWSNLLHVLDQANSKLGNRQTKWLKTLPKFPFTMGGMEKSECIRRLYRSDMLLTKNCRIAIDFASTKMDEIEFQWNNPISDCVLYLYTVIAVASIYGLQRKLVGGETRRQRSRRHFIQALKDPVLRHRMELDFIQDRGEEETAKTMERLNARAAAYEAEAQADSDWKKQEFLNEAWKQRMQYLVQIRLVHVTLCCLSLLLLWIDQPKAGRVLDGIMVALIALLATYKCLPRSPHHSSKKIAEETLRLMEDAK